MNDNNIDSGDNKRKYRLNKYNKNKHLGRNDINGNTCDPRINKYKYTKNKKFGPNGIENGIDDPRSKAVKNNSMLYLNVLK
ncbi:MAG: hypothetical protein GY738_10295 [Pseudoalteromonas sp.]|nr:hypothetical protein [Pseudoalteromonas sp.]